MAATPSTRWSHAIGSSRSGRRSHGTYWALPETYLTAWGSLVEAMDVRAGQTLLIRGGTSSVGMAAASLANDMGLRVIATTRDPAKADALRANGADDVIIDTGHIVEEVVRRVPTGIDEIVAAHHFMDENRGSGQLVIVIDA